MRVLERNTKNPARCSTKSESLPVKPFTRKIGVLPVVVLHHQNKIKEPILRSGLFVFWPTDKNEAMESPLPIAPPLERAHRVTTEKPPRSQFIVALRAIAALIIVGHHFALYPPLRQWAAPLIGGVLDLLELHARATQVFFVVGGYVLAGSLSHHHWTLRQMGAFITQRYVRLGIPYLGAIALTLSAYVIARGWLPESVLGSPVTVPQLLAHLFFLQGILGYEQLSAGLWFVCINFQLGLVYAFLLLLRDTLGRGKADLVGVLGWILVSRHINYET